MKEEKYKNIIFDLDSTLVRIEGLDELARRRGKYREVSKLTKLAMEGKIDFQKSMIDKIRMISPNPGDLAWLGKLYIKNLVYGSKKLIRVLRNLDKELYLITGNFRPAVLPVAQCLGIKERNVFCNEIFFDSGGQYQGFTSQFFLSRNGGKADLIRSLNLSSGSVLVGDGVTDLEAKGVVDLFIGYGGVKVRKNVEVGADVYVKNRNICSILPLVSEQQNSIHP